MRKTIFIILCCALLYSVGVVGAAIGPQDFVVKEPVMTAIISEKLLSSLEERAYKLDSRNKELEKQQRVILQKIKNLQVNNE